jgi:proteic killer suppression protein
VDIAFANTRLEKLVSSKRDLQRKLGQRGAQKVAAHVASLRAAARLEEFKHLPGRCHELDGSRAGQLALDLPDGKRLIFEPASNPPPKKPDGGLDWTAVRSVRLLEIEDYH